MRLFEADVVDGFLNGQFTEAGERETEEKADAAVEKQERFAKRTLDAFGWAFYRGGIGNAPMRGHGLAGPDGADFTRGVIADGEDKIEFGRAGLRKFIPILAAQTGDRQASEFELPERERMDAASRMASRAVGRKSGSALFVENRLRHDRARGITGTEKEHAILRVRGRHQLFAGAGVQQVGAQQDAEFAAFCIAGLRARIKALANLPSTCGAILSTLMPWAVRNCRASSMV